MTISNQDVYDRMGVLDSAMSTWAEAENLWLRAHENFKQGYLDAIYPSLIIKMTEGMDMGIQQMNTAFRALSQVYDQYASNPKFVSQYNDRIEMLGIIQEEIQTHMQDLQKVMTVNSDIAPDSYNRFHPEYSDRFKQGDARVQELVEFLEQTKVIMQSAIPSQRPKAKM